MAISQYKQILPTIGVPALSDVQTFATSAPPPFGYEVVGQKVASASNDTGGLGKFVLVQGSNVASVGQMVMIHNGSAILAENANSASALPIGIACAVLSATSQYGWVQVEGYVDYARGTNSAIAAGIPIYLCTASSGFAVSSAVTGHRIMGMVAPVSYTSSQSLSMTLQLNRPFIAGASAAL
jgi:hypothetical protein